MVRKVCILLLSALFLSTLVACGCGGDPVVSQCSKDSDCSNGDVCIDKNCGKGCVKNDSCGDDELCENKKCVKKECTPKKPCPDGKICNDKGSCIPDPNASCDSPGQSCSGGKICCDLGNGKGKACNFKRCLKDEDCVAGQSKNTCAEPISCASDEKNGLCTGRL